MSNSDLLAVAARLPDRCMEKAIMDCVDRHICACEYVLADALISVALGRLKKRPALSASLTALGVKIAVRTRDFDLAISRFGQIAAGGCTDEIINLQSDALYYLAEGLLPERPSLLFSLWQECLADRLTGHARFNLCSLGRLLAANFARIGNYEMVRRIGAELEALKVAGERAGNAGSRKNGAVF